MSPGAYRMERTTRAMPEPAYCETIIRPVAGDEHVALRQLWRYRHLLGSLIAREIRVKFDNMRFGAAWSCARPLLTVVVLVFWRLSSSTGWTNPVPFSLYIYTGIIFWFYFSDCVVEVSQAVQRDAGIISKVFYPRLVSPIVPLAANTVDLGIAALPIVGFMIYYGVHPGWQVLLLPVVLLVGMLFVLGVGLVFSSLILHRRDWERVLGLFVYLGMFVSPVFITLDSLPPNVRLVATLNPFAGVLNAARACLVSTAPFPTVDLLIAAVFALVLALLGIRQFRRLQDRLLELL